MHTQNLLIRGMLVVNLVFSATMISFPNLGHAQEQKNKNLGIWHQRLDEAYKLKEQAEKIFKKDMENAEKHRKQAVSDLEGDIQRAKDRVKNAEQGDFDAAISDAIEIKKEATIRYNRKLAEVDKLKSDASRRYSSNLKKVREKVDAIGLDAERKIDQEEAKVKSIVEGKKTPVTPPPPC